MQKTWYFQKTNSQIMRLRNGEKQKHDQSDVAPRDSLFNSFANLKQSSVENKINHKVIKYENGSVYTGQTLDNLRHGKGTFQDAQGNVYEGEFKDDKIDGFGTYKTSEGTVYTGEWKNEVQEGHGKETWPDGSYFIGGYLKGLKNGNGEYKWEDGSEYNGQWINGDIEGFVY